MGTGSRDSAAHYRTLRRRVAAKKCRGDHTPAGTKFGEDWTLKEIADAILRKGNKKGKRND